MPQKKRSSHLSFCVFWRVLRPGDDRGTEQQAQSKSKSRIGRPVSGVSLAFFTAS
jgi:hypothetical protein